MKINISLAQFMNELELIMRSKNKDKDEEEVKKILKAEKLKYKNSIEGIINIIGDCGAVIQV